MTNKENKEFKIFVQDTLMKKYQMNETDAARAVRSSYLSTALNDDIDFVEHDTVEEWADFVYNETKKHSHAMSTI